MARSLRRSPSSYLVSLLTITAALMLLLTAKLSACTVPVFRYALEQWESDLYLVEILYNGKLSRDDQAIVDFLRKHERVPDEDSGFTNFHVRLTDVQKKEGQPQEPERPTMVLRFPLETRLTTVIWRGELTLDNAARLINSPVRKEIARRILAGDSAVWILLKSGNEKTDTEAEAVLKKELEAAQAEFGLPELAPEDAAREAPEDLPEIRVSFSAITLSRQDPAESILIATLLRTEPDLLTFDDEPIAFPVFGQGRSLFALVGKGISKDNIHDTCGFLTGACSCVVKRLNPGVDLLTTAVWWSQDQTSAIKEIKLPPLTRIAPAALSGGVDDPSALVLPQKSTGGSAVVRNVVIALVGLALVVLVISVFAMKRTESSQ